MAQRTMSSGSQIRPHRTLHGHFAQRTFPESTGQSFLTGYPVQVEAVATSAHRIEEAGSNSVTLLGFAGADASSVQDNSVNVYLAVPGNEFRGVLKGGALVSSHFGATRQLAKDTTLNVYYVDHNSTFVDSTVGTVVITDVTIPGNDIGDTNAEVGFIVQSRYTAFDNTPSSIAGV